MPNPNPQIALFLAVFVPFMAYVAYQTWKTFKSPSRASKQQESAFWAQFERAQKIRRK